MLVAALLLNERVACGIGNVYKSEALFVERCHSATLLSVINDDRLCSLYACAAQLLDDNRRGGRRITRHANDEAGHLWAYGRTGQPCMHCDTPIASMLLGRNQRPTSWSRTVSCKFANLPK